MKELTIGLDWDGTVSDYVPGFSFLADLFDKCVIITVNVSITKEMASSTLGIDCEKLTVEICPDDNVENNWGWKADICVNRNVDIMFDDDPRVVLACLNKGIKAINVREFEYRFSSELHYSDNK